jgi:L-asparaginase II
VQDNPILVEVTRGSLVESCHRGAVAIADADGRVLLALGDVERPVYPRSAIKAFQALPLVESGAADAFGLRRVELAIACASHSGEDAHLNAVHSLLTKAGLDEAQLACGAHWPISERASKALTRAGKTPTAIHNNCSGKHAGMVATAVYKGLDPAGYERLGHPIQQEIKRILSETCGVALEDDAIGIDGCSVPTFALPLASVATGFARLASGRGLTSVRAKAAQRLMDACFAAPDLVAGEGRFDTAIMRKLGDAAFLKGGAEGVHCGALPGLGIGVAVKVDDGTKRGAERVLYYLLSRLIPSADQMLVGELAGEIRNWHGERVGTIGPAPALKAAVRALPRQSSAAAVASR